ncbi:MAG: hypothetical protein A2Z99_03505 [Treponema sp. GWB1_62_6]|nr:MAG: hypothetical protein A2Z99_03505 [Treponema sp. GWB1_62_6]OHE67398.1 MAG: hypothetical protein A2001_07260 [Treponema sp. GWC1_61_84]OHE74712.1 MAG: hypothetical protein A2413_13085 [Treponema sp. RIFOXYC1_FULL_61_9]HCM27491.1 class I SAM-dependent methyltransferase [Treponema sp.]
MTESERHSRLFDRIALPYSWFFSGQTRSYAACFEAGRGALPPPAGKKALDLGCGTGAFTAALRKEGWETVGIDAAPAMVSVAGRRGIACAQGNLLKGLPYPDKSFDLVSAAYVAHGLVREDRRLLFAEAGRLSRGVVLFHDYNGERSFLTDFIEWLEGGDYFNFIGTIADELRSAFSDLRIVPVGKQSAWYVCTP